jgi:5-methylthioadenosine/S-adenosylhomocysteine deaminase
MARTLLLGDPVVTLQDGEPFIRRGGVVVDGARIVEVGPAERFEDRSGFDKVLGSNDHIVMPGLANAHLHGENAYGKDVYDAVWEKANVWYHEDLTDAPEEDLHIALIYGFLQNIKNGTTCTLDFFYGRPNMPHLAAEIQMRAYEDTGLRTALAISNRNQNIYMHRDDEEVLRRLPPEYADQIRANPVGYAYPLEQSIGAFEAMSKQYQGRHGRLHVILAPDWTPACSDDLLRRNKQLAKEYDTGIQIHLVETKYEMLWNLKTHGKTGPRRLYDLGFLGEEVSGAHCVWPTDDDIKILAETGVTISNNPGSNLRLTSGISPVRDMLNAGVRVALGSDGISLNDDNDLFAEMRLGGLLQRLPGADSGRIPSETLLRNACRNGAFASRFLDVGVLQPGWQADIITLDKTRFYWPPEKFPTASPLDVIVDRAMGYDVRDVMIAGELLMEGRKFTKFDEAEVRQRVAEAAPRIFTVPEKFIAIRPAVQVLYDQLMEMYREWDSDVLPPRYQYNIKSTPEKYQA